MNRNHLRTGLRRLPPVGLFGVLLIALALLIQLTAASASVSASDSAGIWRNPPLRGNPFKGVAFVDAAHGRVTGGNGVVLTTPEGDVTDTTPPTVIATGAV